MVLRRGIKGHTILQVKNVSVSDVSCIAKGSPLIKEQTNTGDRPLSTPTPSAQSCHRREGRLCICVFHPRLTSERNVQQLLECVSRSNSQPNNRPFYKACCSLFRNRSKAVKWREYRGAGATCYLAGCWVGEVVKITTSICGNIR